MVWISQDSLIRQFLESRTAGYLVFWPAVDLKKISSVTNYGSYDKPSKKQALDLNLVPETFGAHTED